MERWFWPSWPLWIQEKSKLKVWKLDDNLWHIVVPVQSQQWDPANFERDHLPVLIFTKTPCWMRRKKMRLSTLQWWTHLKSVCHFIMWLFHLLCFAFQTFFFISGEQLNIKTRIGHELMRLYIRNQIDLISDIVTNSG